MKHISIILIIFSAAITWSSCKQGGGKTTNTEAHIEFELMEYDYGEIAFDGDGTVDFEFRNSGSEPLLVTHVKSTCGCTIPEWSKEPVLNGKKGTIHVEYDTRRVGRFTKSIYVYSNAANGPQKLMITGTVQKAATE